MNTQSNAMNSTPVAGQAVGPSEIPASQQFYMSVRRELWENRSIYIAPLAVAVLFLLGFLVSSIRLTQTLNSASSAQLHDAIAQPYDLVAVMIMAVTFFVAIFYCLDALYGERRDRSILFWKSLPVSDTTIVLSKMAVPVVVVPLIAFALTVGVHLMMLLLGSAILQGSGVGAATLWRHVPPFHMFHTWAVLFVHLVAGHGLLFAPFYAWLLLVSAWARRTPFLWAVLPPLAIAGVEKIAFNTTYFAGMLLFSMEGGTQPSEPAATMTMDAMTPALGELLSSPGLWIGFAVAAVFLVGAIRLRRDRGPI